MFIAVTGGSGFIGRYILRQLVNQGHHVRAMCRTSSDRSGLDDIAEHLEWREGELGNAADARSLVDDCDAVVHAALDRPGKSFRAGEGELISFCQKNIIGSLQLIQAAKDAQVKRFVFVSTCAVHDKILNDRPLDETHPTWSASHYGAHKAAVEQFVYSFGLGEQFPICAIRPTGVYGVNHPVRQSKWYELVAGVARGETVTCEHGGKEVHASDVAKAIGLLIAADDATIRGHVFNCYDRYVSQFEVATIAKRLSQSEAAILGRPTLPKSQIETQKIERLGMTFGGQALLESTIGSMLTA